MTARDLSFDSSHTPLSSDESIGFCFPVHGWRPPLVLREWLKRASLPDYTGRYVWALCTMGDTVGEAMDLFASDLSARGIEIDSRYSVQMPETYIGLPGMNTDTIEMERSVMMICEYSINRLTPCKSVYR